MLRLSHIQCSRNRLYNMIQTQVIYCVQHIDVTFGFVEATFEQSYITLRLSRNGEIFKELLHCASSSINAADEGICRLAVTFLCGVCMISLCWFSKKFMDILKTSEIWWLIVEMLCGMVFTVWSTLFIPVTASSCTHIYTWGSLSKWTAVRTTTTYICFSAGQKDTAWEKKAANYTCGKQNLFHHHIIFFFLTFTLLVFKRLSCSYSWFSVSHSSLFSLVRLRREVHSSLIFYPCYSVNSVLNNVLMDGTELRYGPLGWSSTLEWEITVMLQLSKRLKDCK